MAKSERTNRPSTPSPASPARLRTHEDLPPVRTQLIGLRATPEEIEFLRAAAGAAGYRTVSAMLRGIINDWLAAQGTGTKTKPKRKGTNDAKPL